MKTISLIFLILISWTFVDLQAQSNKYPKAVIRYADGSFLIGDIIDENEYEIILENDQLGAKMIAQKDLIRRIYRSDKNAIIYPKGKVHLTKGRYISYGISFPMGNNPGMHLDILGAYRFNEKVILGFGTGIYFNESYLRGLNAINQFIPVYAYGRYNLTKGKKRLFAFSKVGYGIGARLGFSDEHTGGPMIQPGIGVTFASKKKKRYSLSLSQYIQHTKGQSNSVDVFSNPVEFDYSLWYNRLMLNFMVEIN